MTNEDFLDVIRESFKTYLTVGTSRSTAKLKPLHGRIAQDLQDLFGKNYSVQAQGYGNDKEGDINGRYLSKKVDITIKKEDKVVAGYAVKFVMRNYSQNSVNYFENMLGETANIRTNGIPYFQIFIIFDKVPYYEDGGKFKKWDIINAHNLDKYLALSKDDPTKFYHTPDKTLIMIIKLKDDPSKTFINSKDYSNYYRSIINKKDLLTYSRVSTDPFDNGVILNDYENFIKRTYHIVLGKLK